VTRKSDLRGIAQPAREHFFWARLYGRRLSWPLTRLILKTKLSAGAVSVVSIALGAVGGICFAFNTALWNGVAVALLLLSWVLDCVDGEVARARGAASLDGEFIDACRHQIACPALFAGIALGVVARHPGAVWLLALGLSSTALSTRFVGGMIDQMVLAGVRRALRKGEAPGSEDDTSERGRGTRRATAAKLTRLARACTPLFVDFNILHILIPVVALDAFGIHLGRWTLLDAVHIAYGAALPVVKLGSMAVAWRQGVSGRVEDVLHGRSPEGPLH